MECAAQRAVSKIETDIYTDRSDLSLETQSKNESRSLFVKAVTVFIVAYFLFYELRAKKVY